MAVVPARPYKPKDKSKAEVVVQIVARWIMAHLRHKTYFTLARLNQDIRFLLDDLNQRPFKKLPGTRRSQFEQLDQPALRTLPAHPYQYANRSKKLEKVTYRYVLSQTTIESCVSMPLAIPINEGQPYLATAYASTVFSSQGMTINGDTFVLYSTGMDRANTYVAASRHKDQCHLFCNEEEIDGISGALDSGTEVTPEDRLTALAQNMPQDRYKILASEYLAHKLELEREQSLEQDLEHELC